MINCNTYFLTDVCNTYGVMQELQFASPIIVYAIPQIGISCVLDLIQIVKSSFSKQVKID